MFGSAVVHPGLCVDWCLVSGCKGRQPSLHQPCPVWAAGLLQDKAEPSETLLSPAAARSQHGHHQYLSQYLVYVYLTYILKNQQSMSSVVGR